MKKRIIAILMALVLALSLCACGPKEDEQQPEPTDTPTAEPTPEVTEITSIVRVEDLYRNSGSYTDEIGNIEDYGYALPRIYAEYQEDTEDIAEANKKIQEISNDIVQPELDNMAGGFSLIAYKVDYEVVTFKSICSILITIDTNFESSSYYCFNFDAEGNAIDNSELLEIMGVSGDEFVRAARELMEKDCIPENEIEGMEGEITRVRDMTLSDENCNAEMPMYLDSEGRLCFVGEVYSIAGADKYSHLFCID